MQFIPGVSIGPSRVAQFAIGFGAPNGAPSAERPLLGGRRPRLLLCKDNTTRGATRRPHVMTLIHPSLKRATKHQREPGIAVRSVVARELADKLRMMATEANCTLSDIIALLLARAVKEK
jgi:hypothetical protein